MQISHVPGVTRVGEITLNGKEYKGKKHVFYKRKLALDYDANFPKELKRKHVSLVYIFCVDGEIYKIGQSSCGTGIQGCMGFYLDSGTDDPGNNRFAMNLLIREKLTAGNKVEVYMIYMEPIEVEVPGLFKTEKMIVPVSAKGIEETCLSQYNAIEGCVPQWNFQENDDTIPDHIHEAFGQYKIDRKVK